MEASAGPSRVNENVKKKPMVDQVCEAINILGKPKIGASYLAIKKHILNAYEESNHGRVLAQIKKAISMGEESGLLVRPSKCKNSVGATGSFLLNAKKSNITMAENPKKHPENRKVKQLYQPEGAKATEKTIKPKATRPKNPKKKEQKDDGDFDVPMTHSTPNNSDTEFEEEPVKTRVLKKTAKNAEDNTFTMKKHTSDSDLTDVKQKTVKRKTLKEKTKTTTRNNKPGTSDPKDNTFTMKKHASDSDLTDVNQKTVKRKNLKEKTKTTTRNNKPGTSDPLKASQVNDEMKKTKRTLKSHNSDSVLM